MNLKRITAYTVLTAAGVAGASAQAMYFNSARVEEPDSATVAERAHRLLQTIREAAAEPDSTEAAAVDEVLAAVADDTAGAPAPEPVQWVLLTDFPTVEEYMAAAAGLPYDTVVNLEPLPRTFFGPAVFDGYTFADDRNPLAADYSGNAATRWLEREGAAARAMERMRRHLFYEHPQAVPYNINLLPEAPKRYTAEVNPEEHTIEIKELVTPDEVHTTIAAGPVRKRHWLQTFSASLQFSQAYVSPNWYQGGNNNVNALANIYYNVKLNQAYHPNLLFETTAQYKLGINNAPDDEVHSYNISDDLFQLTSTFGVKAARRWYYSISLLFKTQLLQSYKSNSEDMRAAFLSPGELNLGLGMTYNYVNAPKTVTFDASIAPLSYNLKTCINSHINPEQFEISAGHKTKHKFGSSAELKFKWKICYNIVYTSRLFAFTDYSNAYADWENTVNFEINRFLSTQIYVHARYDTSTPRCDDPGWHKLQLKEILSIGFAYKFSSITEKK